MIAASGFLTIDAQTSFCGTIGPCSSCFSAKKSRRNLSHLRAIKTNQTGAYVFSVKEDNTVEIRSVKLGHEEKGMIVVEAGLDGASKVVTEGQLRLFPGSKVEEVR